MSCILRVLDGRVFLLGASGSTQSSMDVPRCPRPIPCDEVHLVETVRGIAAIRVSPGVQPPESEGCWGRLEVHRDDGKVLYYPISPFVAYEITAEGAIATDGNGEFVLTLLRLAMRWPEKIIRQYGPEEEFGPIENGVRELLFTDEPGDLRILERDKRRGVKWVIEIATHRLSDLDPDFVLRALSQYLTGTERDWAWLWEMLYWIFDGRVTCIREEFEVVQGDPQPFELHLRHRSGREGRFSLFDAEMHEGRAAPDFQLIEAFCRCTGPQCLTRPEVLLKVLGPMLTVSQKKLLSWKADDENRATCDSGGWDPATRRFGFCDTPASGYPWVLLEPYPGVRYVFRGQKGCSGWEDAVRSATYAPELRLPPASPLQSPDRLLAGMYRCQGDRFLEELIIHALRPDARVAGYYPIGLTAAWSQIKRSGSYLVSERDGVESKLALADKYGEMDLRLSSHELGEKAALLAGKPVNWHGSTWRIAGALTSGAQVFVRAGQQVIGRSLWYCRDKRSEVHLVVKSGENWSVVALGLDSTASTPILYRPESVPELRLIPFANSAVAPVVCLK